MALPLAHHDLGLDAARCEDENRAFHKKHTPGSFPGSVAAPPAASDSSLRGLRMLFTPLPAPITET